MRGLGIIIVFVFVIAIAILIGNGLTTMMNDYSTEFNNSIQTLQL